MSLANWYLHGINFEGPTPDVFLGQLTSLDADTAVEELVAHASGFPYPTFRGVSALPSTVNFTTPQLKALFDLCKLTDAAGLLGYASSAANASVFYKKGTNLGTREAVGSSVHLKLNSTRSLTNWLSLRVAQGGIAEASCTIKSLYDGTNAIWVPTGTVTLTDVTVEDASLFTMGPVKINGTQLDGVSDWSLDLGIVFDDIAESGDLYHKHRNIVAVAPVLTINGRAADWWTAFGPYGSTTALTSLYLGLRAKQVVGGTYADVQTKHITITGDTAAADARGMISLVSTGGGGLAPAKASLRIGMYVSATTKQPLYINTGVAIT